MGNVKNFDPLFSLSLSSPLVTYQHTTDRNLKTMQAICISRDMMHRSAPWLKSQSYRHPVTKLLEDVQDREEESTPDDYSTLEEVNGREAACSLDLGVQTIPCCRA